MTEKTYACHVGEFHEVGCSHEEPKEWEEKRKKKLNLFKEWLINHSSVFQEDRYWYVQNCLGTLGVFTWEELSEMKIDPFLKASKDEKIAILKGAAKASNEEQRKIYEEFMKIKKEE